MSNRQVKLNIQEIRIARGQTLTEFQRSLAEAGVSFDLAQLSRIDRKMRGASTPKILQLATALNMPMESLIAGEPCTAKN